MKTDAPSAQLLVLMVSLFFVSNPDSPYYESNAFGAILAYAGQNPLTCRLREDGTKRSLSISNVPDVESAINILQTVQMDRIPV